MRHLTATCAPTQDDGNEQDGCIVANPITHRFEVWIDGICIDSYELHREASAYLANLQAVIAAGMVWQ
jgi:hypothetical protein